MPRLPRAWRMIAGLVLSACVVAGGQTQAARSSIVLTAVDENGVAVAGAEITLYEPNLPVLELWTDYAGHCRYMLREQQPYRIHAEKPGFYQTDATGVDPQRQSVRLVMVHEQMVREQVNVTASSPGIDTEQTSDTFTLNTPEIVNIPYHTSRDIRYLLPFYPGVILDAAEQAHVAGSESWETLDTLDGFDMRSPVNGALSMRVSADAVRSIDAESTRYPVEFGRATGGVLAFYTGMGDNKFRFNATNFLPSFRDQNGIRFDNFVPRFTFSGPLLRDHAWFDDGLELEYDNIYIAELPAGADTDKLTRGSNLIKAQANLTPSNIVTGGLLFNEYHSPYDGISSLTPRDSTVKRNTIAWLPYLRDQWSLKSGALVDVGLGVMRVRDGYEPHGDTPYSITPELPVGSYFENLAGRSQRVEATAVLYLPPHQWMGRHGLKAGIDLDHIGYDQRQQRAPVRYLREDGTLLRVSAFPPVAPFTLHNDELGAYAEDRWQPAKGWLLEPGLRFDWDAIVRRPLLAPRLAAVYAPPAHAGSTKISAGIGLYYEHTQLAYLTQAYAGQRTDTYYEADGLTPAGPAQATAFRVNRAALQAPRAVNGSVSVEQQLPWSIYAAASFMVKHTARLFTYALPSGATAGDYQLTNARLDRYRSEEFDLRRIFAGGYTVFVAYTHSSARTNAALGYLPTPSPLGPQQSGPLAWDAPQRVLSWGWLPVPLGRLRKRWDFVYLVDARSGFPYTSVDASDTVVGAAGGRRFPADFNFSPGLEWKFHFRGAYFGLRGVMENATGSSNPAEVNAVVDSPLYGSFSEFEGRAVTARLRLIGTK